VLVEVPAAISQLALWRDKIDFVSVGSNDLSQYLLAIDRNNGRVAYLYDHVHPAVLREINRIVDIGREIDLPVSICGEMASDAVAVILLLGMGVRTLSISSAKLPRIKWLIRSISISEAESFLSQAMQIDDAESIRSAGIAFIKEKGLDELVS
jgi:phosphotransferase system enzyme I (PtsI)/phosphotransferase system enzyme I (PtsP)